MFSKTVFKDDVKKFYFLKHKKFFQFFFLKQVNKMTVNIFELFKVRKTANDISELPKVRKITTNFFDLFKVGKMTIDFLTCSKSVSNQKESSKKQPSEKKLQLFRIRF